MVRPALWDDLSDVEDRKEAECPETRRPGDQLDGYSKSSSDRVESRGDGWRGWLEDASQD